MNQNHGSADKSTRIISGSAYRKGIRSGLEILGKLRAGRYKAKSPESGLNLDTIATHAAQAISISLTFVILIAGVWILKSIFIGLISGANSLAWQANSQFGHQFWRFIAEAFRVLNISLGIVGALAVAYEKVYLRWSIPRKFLRKNYRKNTNISILEPLDSKIVKPLSKTLKNRVLLSSSRKSQNVITFGGFRPFLGAGEKVAGWSLSIPRTSMDGHTTVNIPLYDFYKVVEDEVEGKNLPNIQKTSKLYVNGLELEVDGQILKSVASRPVAKLPENQIWALAQSNKLNNKRVYRIYRYYDRERDMMLSYFLRFYNVGSVTFAEGVTYTLPSIDRDRFSLTPLLNDSKTSRVIKTLILAAILFPFNIYTLIALWHLIVYLFNVVLWWANDVKQLRAAKAQEEYNYGLTETFRESVAAPIYQNYYGIQDLTMYWQTLDRAIIKGILDLLRQNNVDTSAFEDSTKNIINNGVMMNGGEFTASQVAVGNRSVSMMRSDNPSPRTGGRLQRTLSQIMPNTQN